MEKLHNEKGVMTRQELNEEEEPPSAQQFISEEQLLTELIQNRLDREKTSLSARSAEFLYQNFPGVSEKDWSSWRWQRWRCPGRLIQSKCWSEYCVAIDRQ